MKLRRVGTYCEACEVDGLGGLYDSQMEHQEVLEGCKGIPLYVREDDLVVPVPETEDGLIAKCGVCRGAIRWQSCPTGGWWIHETHPTDAHDAEHQVPKTESYYQFTDAQGDKVNVEKWQADTSADVLPGEEGT